MREPPVLDRLRVGTERARPQLVSRACLNPAPQEGPCTNPGTYIARANVELAKLAGTGMSVLVCAQDEGAPSDNNMESTP